MFFKIFFSVLLLTCAYAYMLESIKDKNNTNFQRLPDNFNFELNGIQTAKQNLKLANLDELRGILSMCFGSNFARKVDKYMKEDARKFFDDDLIEKIWECQNLGEYKKIFKNDILPKLEKDYNAEEQKVMEDDFHKFQETPKNVDILLEQNMDNEEVIDIMYQIN